jgi:2-phospho-L-lactate/phosphoenolpyruvate guanylyltransferase
MRKALTDAHMRALLLPIKDLRFAKQRLAATLSADQRFGLAQAMLADTVRAVGSIRSTTGVFVITNYEPAAEAARQNGWHLLQEAEQTSESASVDAASLLCEERGVTSLLRLPLDLPLLQSADIDALLQTPCGAPGMLIVPSRDGTGTNALLRTPPALFPSRFGTGSFAKHIAEAQRLGAHIVVHRNPHLEMDVDDESDLRIILQQDLRGTETGRWLHANGIASLLQKLSAQDATHASIPERSNTATPH